MKHAVLPSDATRNNTDVISVRRDNHASMLLMQSSSSSQMEDTSRHIPRRLQHYLDRLELNDPILTELNLRHHALDEYCYGALIQSLRSNRMLKRLYISFSSDSTLFESSIQLLSSLPNGLRFLDLDLTVLPNNNFDRIFEALRLQENFETCSTTSITSTTVDTNTTVINRTITDNRRRSSIAAPTLIQELCIRFPANHGDSGVASLAKKLFLPINAAADMEAASSSANAHDVDKDLDGSLNDFTGHSDSTDLSAVLASLSISVKASIISSLQILDLRNNGISNLGAVALAEALPHAEKLKELNLSYNSIGDEGICAITTKLKHTQQYANCPLDRLDLSCNQIGKEGCVGLGEFLQTNRSVAHLNLFCNPNIGLNGARHLLTALATNDMLQDLHLEGSSCSHPSTRERLEYFLRLNRAGRKIFRTHNWMTSLWPSLLGRISEEPDLLWYFLREQPDLVQYAGEHRD